MTQPTPCKCAKPDPIRYSDENAFCRNCAGWKDKIPTGEVTGCEWEWVAAESYNTACGNAFLFSFEGIKENGFNFCPFCGKPIKEKRA